MPHEVPLARTPWACREHEPTAAQAPQAKREGASRAWLRRTTERRGRAINQQATSPRELAFVCKPAELQAEGENGRDGERNELFGVVFAAFTLVNTIIMLSRNPVHGD